MGLKNSITRKKILKELYFSSPLTCAELSLKTEKSFPKTTKLITELMEEGFIKESGFASSTGGRRPLTYALQKDIMYVVSVATDQFTTRVAIMDMDNNFVTEVVRMELPLNHPEVVNLLVKQIAAIIDSSGISLNEILGVGIGMPGFVNVKKGINHSYLHVAQKSFIQHVSEILSLPVFIDNDSSLIALAELRFGVAKNIRNAMVINIGWGIGLGLILNGELYRGNDGFAGEFSHIPLFLNGKLCSCGKTGCLETETSLLEIIKKGQEGLNAGKLSKLTSLSLEHVERASDSIIEAALMGDRFAIELISEAGYNIGKGVAILIHLLNPQVVILSGRGSTAGQIWTAPIQQAINENSIPRLAASTVLQMSSLGHNAELIGAAALVMENFEKITINNTEKMQLESAC